MALRVYLDTCCVHRPFDDQAALRVHRESETVLAIIRHCASGELTWIASDVLRFETGMASAQHVREGARVLLQAVGEWVPLTGDIRARARGLEDVGMRSLDALHVASAEAGGANALLTVDDKLLRIAVRNPDVLRLRVLNPIIWLDQEGI